MTTRRPTAAREKAKTPRYKEVRQQHPKVERKLGELARWHKMRHARYWGTPKVLIQAVLTCFVVNAKQFLKLLEGPAKPTVGTVRPRLERSVSQERNPGAQWNAQAGSGTGWRG